MAKPAVNVALARAQSYDQPDLPRLVGELLDAGQIHVAPGDRALVKPNLLMAHALSCADPRITAAGCQWLLDRGAKITVADSPAFGSAPAVAQAIGLTAALKPLGLTVRGYSGSRKIWLHPAGSEKIAAGVAREALDCDLILSIPRVKAHSQVRLTLSVKNCFGCLCGLRKALAHAPLNMELALFTDRVAALWSALPPVAALCDGITAMSVTGPRHGQPFHLGLMGASASAPALDAALIKVLGLDPGQIPLGMALARRHAAGDQAACPDAIYPLSHPADLAVSGFVVPQTLKNISFNPLALAKSLTRRIWQSLA